MANTRAAWSSEDALNGRLLWVAAGVVFLIQLVGFHGVRSDDAYITYRYGQNLASGLGLVFNPGQRVQGSTSPGSMLTSGLVYRLCGLTATPTVMAALGCLGWTGQAVATYRLALRAVGRLSAAALALAIALGVAGAAGYVPLETNLVAACVLFAFVFAGEKRWTGAALACGLAVLFRPDALVAAAVLLVMCLRDLRGRALRPAATFLAVALPWPLFATLYYGNPLPQTAVSKFQQSPLIRYLLHELALPGQVLFRLDSASVWNWAALALVLVGAARLVRRDARWWPLLAYGFLHAAAYLVLLPPGQHGWHLYPWAVVSAISALAALAPAPGATAFEWERRVRSLALAGALILIAGRFVIEWRDLASSYWFGQRDAAYRQVADYLRYQAPPDSWYASVEVGTISYYSQRSAYDLGGLVTRADDPIDAHPVRYIVVEKTYRRPAPPSPPVFTAREGDFEASVYGPLAAR